MGHDSLEQKIRTKQVALQKVSVSPWKRIIGGRNNKVDLSLNFEDL